MTLTLRAAILTAPREKPRVETIGAEQPHACLRGELLLDGLVTQRIALERGFGDLKAGRAVRSAIVFGDAA